MSPYLVVSSLGFLGPALFASYKGLYFPSRMLLLVSFASANYWRNPVSGWRRAFDIVAERTCFVYFFINGAYYNTYYSMPLQMIGWSCTALNLYCYQKSCHLKTLGDPFVHYHIAFHMTTIFMQYFVLQSLPTKHR